MPDESEVPLLQAYPFRRGERTADVAHLGRWTATADGRDEVRGVIWRVPEGYLPAVETIAAGDEPPYPTVLNYRPDEVCTDRAGANQRAEQLVSQRLAEMAEAVPLRPETDPDADAILSEAGIDLADDGALEALSRELDDSVHELAQELSLSRLNATESAGGQEVVIASSEAVASEVNNGGARAQISYLLAHDSRAVVLDIVRSAVLAIEPGPALGSG